jgi:hypothetical protein
MAYLDIEELANVPPALVLIWGDFAAGHEWGDIRKRVRSGLRDFKSQSLDFESRNVARKEPVDVRRFEVHPHGALDLMAGDGCIALDCRIAAAERLARSLGLFADRIWLTDHVSTEVVDIGRATNDSIDRIIHHAVALAPLLPLIKAGIVRFRSPWIATCSNCSKEFDNEVERATQAVLRTFTRQVKVEKDPSGGYFVRTGNFFVPPVVHHSYSRDHGDTPSSRAYAESLVAREVRRILWAAREATFTRGSVFSNSRVGLAGMLHCDGKLPSSSRGLRVFEDSRAFDLPWVSELDPAQVLQLREEASQAIPLLRELLARVATANAPGGSASAGDSMVAELRAQAEEVRAELTAKQKKSARYWRTAYGILGLGISAYGIGADQTLAALGGLLPVLQLLIEHRTTHEAETEKLLHRPGYVLIKAQDLLAHAH